MTSLPSRAARGAAQREAVLHLWLANIAFGVFLGLGYLRHVPDSDEPRLWLFVLPALVSSIVTLTLAPGLVFTLWAPFTRSPRALGIAQAVVWAFFHVWLYADYRVYNTFRYHFGEQVFTVIFARGSEDAIYLGWSVWSTVILGLAGVALAELFLWKRFLATAAAVQAAERPPRRLARPVVIWCAVLLPAVFLEKSLYAQADLEQDRELTTLSDLFPVYPKLPAADIASSLLGVDVPERPHFELEGIALDYPLERPELPADGPRPNMLVVVIDCWRSDMLDAERTPALAAWAQTARSHANHLSGGNSTRFGLFSLLYGLHGSYWFPIAAERRSPVLIDALLDAGYDVRFYSSASMDFVELRTTTCAEIPESVYDDFPAEESWQRDALAAEACTDWLRERAGDEGRPFFAFLMLDAPHQTYSYPPEHAVFQPAAAELDYMAVSARDGPPPGVLAALKNRYQNAVHYADSVAGGVLATLEELGLADDTLVVVTGDHGEEFMEQGYFGHTSTHGPPQVRVPFLIRGPGVEPGVESRPTAHVDFAPTLLELLGADPERRGLWSVGLNLLAPPEERRRVVSGWNELGLWTPDGILRIRLGGTFEVRLYDYGWRFVPQDWDVLEHERAPLELLAEECNRFLR